ncbi:hypothetical protein Taro_004555 [Colocasia esculenta]|uniref:Pectate lyase n=1 Tax=Colocasia esculenta TaxID=4460 RepID=A0A843TKF7_COLES|nr:hypothetical protein [Colocasia esculenta]
MNSSCRRALCLLLLLCLLACSSAAPARRSRRSAPRTNVIDACWRGDPNWAANRQRLAQCSVGFAGKMAGNAGRDVTMYRVTDPSDDPANPRPGTLRYGATVLPGKVWITFARPSMYIRLQRPLLVKSFTTIDGRGANIHIAEGAGFLLHEVSNVIIHSLRFHGLRPHPPGPVKAPGGAVIQMGSSDGDAIRLISSSKIWIDHNTLYDCYDGLLDVTRGSTMVTVSNNWFRNHNKVMLLGHDDNYAEDRNMKVTVVYNRFGPRANQRMPRVRHGYAHVVNNFYQGWGLYAIGGSMNPSILSEANVFVAPKEGNKKVTWREDGGGAGKNWNWASVRDAFINGAAFEQTGSGGSGPGYNRQQWFPVAAANDVGAFAAAYQM